MARAIDSNPTITSSVTITVDELARAIDSMPVRLTPTVSAGLLYQAILQVQPPKMPLYRVPKDQHLPRGVVRKLRPDEITPDQVERRRKLLEMAKASFPNGVPDPYALLDSSSEDQYPFKWESSISSSDLNANDDKNKRSSNMINY